MPDARSSSIASITLPYGASSSALMSTIFSRLVLENLVHAPLQVGFGHRQAVNVVLAAGGDGDDRLPLRFGLVGAVGCGRQPDRRALLQERGDDHHDDEQDEHDVDKRRHVDVRLYATLGSADIH